MATHKDIAIKIGTYTDRNGAEKNRYKTIGRMVTKDDGGEFLMLDADIFHASLFALVNKERKDRVLCSIFEPRDETGAAKTPPTGNGTPEAFADLSSDIPF
jgi:hypothetical protein